jgi:hypothetical protein
LQKGIQQFYPQVTILSKCSVQIANSEHYYEFRNSVTAKKMKKKRRKKMIKIWFLHVVKHSKATRVRATTSASQELDKCL